MCFFILQDYIKHFTTVEICDVTPEVYNNEEDDENGNSQAQQSMSHEWKIVMYEGAWVSKHTAGGCRNFIGELYCPPLA